MADLKIRIVDKADEAQWRSLWAAYNTFYQRNVEEGTTQRTSASLAGPQGNPMGLRPYQTGNLLGLLTIFRAFDI